VKQITQILRAIEHGNASAAGDLLPIVYDELRKLAAQRLAHESPGQTLQATALVHEAYLRLVGGDAQADAKWDSRGHFFAAAAEAMRRILIDRAREKRAQKRGGARRKLTLDAADISIDAVPEEIIELDEALSRLAAEDAVKAELVKLRFFAGLTLKDAARILGISSTTADRYWAYARAWLYQAITSSSTDPESQA
jgi:RNA polymerase sigma factor (TIGR02999 family)